MNTPLHRWSLHRISTNDHGTTHYTLSFNLPCTDNGDEFWELADVLQKRLGAVAQEPLVGPYSVHFHFHVEGLCLGVILDDPGWIPLYAMHELGRPAMEAFVDRLLTALNEGDERHP
jgi:hypothetical protein